MLECLVFLCGSAEQNEQKHWLCGVLLCIGVVELCWCKIYTSAHSNKLLCTFMRQKAWKILVFAWSVKKALKRIVNYNVFGVLQRKVAGICTCFRFAFCFFTLSTYYMLIDHTSLQSPSGIFFSSLHIRCGQPNLILALMLYSVVWVAPSYETWWIHVHDITLSYTTLRCITLRYITPHHSLPVFLGDSSCCSLRYVCFSFARSPLIIQDCLGHVWEPTFCPLFAEIPTASIFHIHIPSIRANLVFGRMLSEKNLRSTLCLRSSLW